MPFQFPPPPPPPPRATVNDAPDQYSSQRGGFNNNRGDRGRGGRGGQRGGRGNGPRGNSRGGSNARGQGNAQRGGPRGGGYQQQQTGPSQNRNAGAYVNTQPTNPTQQSGTQTPQQADPAALAQAMAFMSTPTGMQTFTAFASQMANGQAPYVSQAPPSQTPQYSPPPQGNKRKRNEQGAPHGSPPSKISQPKTKPPRAKAAPPPAIPSFGFSLPTAPIAQPSHDAKSANKDREKKRKINLGLTQRKDGDPVPENSDEEEVEEDIDEEAVFALNPDFQGMAFEYNGLKMSLQTPAEVAAWIKDRRKQYPTKDRAEAKAREAAERRAGELAFLRKVQGKKKVGGEPEKGETSRVPDTPGKQPPEDKKVGLADLRAKVQQSIMARRGSTDKTLFEPTGRKAPTIDLGLGYASDSDSADGSSILEESSVVSSSEESEEEADEDSDSAPDEVSTKAAPPAIVVPPPPPAAPTISQAEQKKKFEPRVCSTWKKFGNCKMGDRCRHTHPPREEEKRLGLYERLVEQEKEKADRVALDAIKWLGRNGFLG